MADIPYRDTYKAIVNRFPKNMASDHIKSNRVHDPEIVKQGLQRIINGRDVEAGYISFDDMEDAKRFLRMLEPPVRR